MSAQFVLSNNVVVDQLRYCIFQFDNLLHISGCIAMIDNRAYGATLLTSYKEERTSHIRCDRLGSSTVNFLVVYTSHNIT